MKTSTRIAADEFDKSSSDGSTDQYLTFSLAGEEYGVDILTVQEVKVWTRVTVLPNTPGYIKGVLNLRGVIVPIIDLRNRFGMSAEDYSDTTVIVILKLNLDNKERVIGLVVDAVSDVLDIPRSSQKPVETFDSHSRSDAVTGIATVSNKMIIMLDPEKLLDSKDLDNVTGKILSDS